MVKVEIRKYLEINEDENTTCPNLWDAAKTVLRSEFINANVKKREKSQATSLLYHKELGKEEQTKLFLVELEEKLVERKK